MGDAHWPAVGTMMGLRQRVTWLVFCLRNLILALICKMDWKRQEGGLRDELGNHGQDLGQNEWRPELKQNKER